MKSLISILATPLLIIACNPKGSPSGDAEEKIDLVHQYIDAVIKQDVETINNLLSDDYVSIG